MKASRNPDRSHELLILWMDLNRAIAVVKRSQNRKSQTEIVPWNCKHRSVALAWNNLTSRKNLQALKQWLEVASREKSRLWTEKAIEQCVRRKSAD
jgi:hypothetical protein